MYFPTTTTAASALFTLLLLTPTSAIPTSPQLTKRLDSIPLTIYSGPTCAQSIYTTTAFIPADGTCFSPSPIFDSNTNSFRIESANLAKLPKGCSCKFALFCFTYLVTRYLHETYMVVGGGSVILVQEGLMK